MEGQEQIAKIQKDCAIEVQKSAERVQKNNNNSNLKALNMEIDFKSVIVLFCYSFYYSFIIQYYSFLILIF